MKAYLRLKGKIRPRRKRSAVTDQSSAWRLWLTTKLSLLPNAYCLIPVLILVFASCSAALAQESVVHTTPASQAETTANKTIDHEITPLKIGDQIPDELWEMYFPVVSANTEGLQYLSLGDFKDKLVILDFWATWCGACISSLHKLDTLQLQFIDDLIVIPISYEPENKIRPFLKGRAINLPSLIEEEELKSYFPYRSIPHQVWIKEGEVIAITSGKEATEINIKSVLQQKNTKLKEKRDLFFDPYTSINTYAQKRNAPIGFKSILTGYIEGLGNQGNAKSDSVWVRYYLNRPVLSIYQNALQIPYNRIKLEVKDYSRYLVDFSDENIYEKLYCYQLFIPPNLDDQSLKRKIINDLNAYLKLASSVQYRNEECYIIKSINEKVEKVDFNGKSNFSFPQFIGLLNYHSSWTPSLNVFINETYYNGNLIEGITPKDISSFKNDLDALREYLALYGFTLIKEKRQIPFFIISEQGEYLNKLKEF